MLENGDQFCSESCRCLGAAGCLDLTTSFSPCCDREEDMFMTISARSASSDLLRSRKSIFGAVQSCLMINCKTSPLM